MRYRIVESDSVRRAVRRMYVRDRASYDDVKRALTLEPHAIDGDHHRDSATVGRIRLHSYVMSSGHKVIYAISEVDDAGEALVEIRAILKAQR